MSSNTRSILFIEKTRKAFAFLNRIGFSEVEASPTLVKYQNGDIEIDVYHGRQSYEIGLGVTAYDTRFSLSEIIRLQDPGAGESTGEVVQKIRHCVNIGLVLGAES